MYICSRNTRRGVYLFATAVWNTESLLSFTEKTIFPFPFTLNGIWSWWQFPFRFSEPNRIPFGSKLEGNLSPRSYPIQCERKWKCSCLSVYPSRLNSESVSHWAGNFASTCLISLTGIAVASRSRLSYLCIMGARLRTPETSPTTQQCGTEGF